MNASLDEHFMRRAIEVARQGWGNTNPNAIVGSVIVEDGAIVAEGFYAKDGGPHAERVALNTLGRPPKPGATVYVTLEPCSTAGRTGACTEALIHAGVTRVVVGATDPFPPHQGAGFQRLREAGVEVVTGVLEQECTDLNLIFNHWSVTGLPLFAAKAAVTLDGRVACRTGDSQWITGEEARRDVHRWRKLFPAIAVGATTVLKDNPRLTIRQPGQPEECAWRFIFDGRLRTVIDRNLPHVYSDEFRAKTIVVTTPHGGEGYVRKLRDAGVQVWICPSRTQRVGFADFRRRCAEAGISGVYFEGGPHLVSQLMHERQLDYFFSYTAPILIGDEKARAMLGGLRTEKLSQALRLTDTRFARLGDDTLCRGRVVYPEKLQVDEATFSLG